MPSTEINSTYLHSLAVQWNSKTNVKELFDNSMVLIHCVFNLLSLLKSVAKLCLKLTWSHMHWHPTAHRLIIIAFSFSLHLSPPHTHLRRSITLVQLRGLGDTVEGINAQAKATFSLAHAPSGLFSSYGWRVLQPWFADSPVDLWSKFSAAPTKQSYVQ